MSYLKVFYRSRFECCLYLMCPKIRQLIISIWVDIFANIHIKSLSVCAAAINLAIYCWANAESQLDEGKNLSLPARRLNGSNYQCCHINGWHTETARSTHTHTYTVVCWSITWYEHGQQFLHCVHGGDQHHAVLLVCQLLLPFVNHLCHFRHALQKNIIKSCARNKKDWGTVQLAIILHIFII